MKKKILILLFLSIGFQVAFGQSETEQDNRFEGYTLQKAKAELEKELWTMEIFQDLGEIFIQDTEDTSEDYTVNTEDIEATESYTIYDSETIQHRLNNYFESLPFTQNLKEPLSEINIEQWQYRVPKFIDNKGRYDIHQPLFTTNKIFFAEGDISEQQVEDFPVTIMNKKFVDSISIDISYTYPTKIKNIILSESNPKYTLGEDYVDLTTLKNKSAQLVVTDGLRSRICAVYAHTTLGNKLVAPTSSSWRTGMNDAMEEYLKQAIEMYKMLILNLEEHKYSNIDEFSKDYWAKAPQYPEKKKEDEINDASFGFEHKIESVEIYYAESFQDYTANFIFRNKDLSHDKPSKFHIASNANDSIGIVDLLGNWIVEPIYYALEHNGGIFYEGKLNEDEIWKTFKLDAENKQLTVCDFETTVVLPHDLLVITELEDTSKKAVIKTDGSIVIPMQEQNIYNYIKEKMFIVEYRNEQKTTNKLFDFSGQQLLPKSYYNIYIVNGYIYITPTAGAKNTIVYNSALKQISTDSWMQVQEFDRQAGLFIIQDRKGNSFCANQDGKVVIAPSKEYTIIDTFSQGCCLCSRETEDGLKYGFIDTTGKIAIPLEYDHAKQFVGKYAYVEKDNEPMLIDLDNNIHVKFPASVTHRFVYNNNLEETRYYLENNQIYDGNGNFIEEYVNEEDDEEYLHDEEFEEVEFELIDDAEDAVF